MQLCNIATAQKKSEIGYPIVRTGIAAGRAVSRRTICGTGSALSLKKKWMVRGRDIHTIAEGLPCNGRGIHLMREVAQPINRAGVKYPIKRVGAAQETFCNRNINTLSHYGQYKIGAIIA